MRRSQRTIRPDRPTCYRCFRTPVSALQFCCLGVPACPHVFICSFKQINDGDGNDVTGDVVTCSRCRPTEVTRTSSSWLEEWLDLAAEAWTASRSQWSIPLTSRLWPASNSKCSATASRERPPSSTRFVAAIFAPCSGSFPGRSKVKDSPKVKRRCRTLREVLAIITKAVRDVSISNTSVSPVLEMLLCLMRQKMLNTV